MRLPTDPKLPVDGNLQSLIRRLYDLFRDIGTQLNGISEGTIAARHAAATAAPSTGKYAKGDFIENKEPAELGTAGSKYIVHGWQCVTAGEPGTWVECRFLTGN